MTIRKHLSDCKACMAHYVANGRFIEDACMATASTYGGSIEKWMRHYFARFHNDGHRRVA